MPLTPIDIQQKTFGPELRGYNMDEVDDFLDDVVVALKDYDQRLRDAEDRIRALEAELSTRGEDESAISRALVAAQKQADTLVTEARVDAEKIRADAEVEADELRSDREAEKMSLTQDIARMRATVADMKRRIVELANAVSTDLDEMDEAAAEAANGIGSDLTDVSNNSPGSTASDAGYMGAAVGEGLDPFADTDGDDSAETADPATVGSHGRSGQHLSAVTDDYATDDDFEDSYSDGEDVGDTEDLTSEDEVDDSYDLTDEDDDDRSDGGEYESAGDDFDELDESEATDADDDDTGVTKVTERRPWERGSV